VDAWYLSSGRPSITIFLQGIVDQAVGIQRAYIGMARQKESQVGTDSTEKVVERAADPIARRDS
jgi:hypothetical protein